MTPKLLFAENDLSSILRAQVERMKQAIAGHNSVALQTIAVDDLVGRFVASARVEPIELDENGIKPEQRTIKVNVRGRFDYAPGFGAGPVLVDGIEVTLRVPFTGDAQLFRFRPSRATLSPPYGTVVGSSVFLPESGPPQYASLIKVDLERALEGLKQHASWSRSDVLNHNSALPTLARDAVEQRRRRLDALPDVASSFSFGKPNGGNSE